MNILKQKSNKIHTASPKEDEDDDQITQKTTLYYQKSRNEATK